ncbi:MAG: hypothetical protein LUJ25_09580 [Firmicutes bacterium]|nr:hypothetical protein [Bacillota bacterium]
MIELKWRPIIADARYVTGVFNLSKESINAILEAENGSKAKRAAAVAEAKRIIADAEERSKNEYESSIAAAERDMKEKLEQVVKGSETLLTKNRTEAEADAEGETRAAMSNMERAVGIIIGAITEHGSL